jgi:MYXO-CTERM domain-containing protein
MRSAAATVAIVAALAARAQAYTVSSPFTRGCHEELTASALRQVRAERPSALPLLPSRDERAMIDDAPFPLDGDMRDLAAATLLFAVRDNDLRGASPTDTFAIVPIAADPTLQREHCLRAADEDEPDGSARALADCAAFIHERTADALDGLDGAGAPDAANRVTLSVYLALRGPHVPVPLPRYWVHIGQALHALEDGFTHNLRSSDGLAVTTVLNWIDYANQSLVESRDGPPHARELDRCDDPDAARARRRQLALAAATELLGVTLDATLARDEKLARVDALVARSLGLQTGCTEANAWCDPAENGLRDAAGCGCQLGARATAPPGAIFFLVAAVLLARRRLSALLVLVALVAVAHAQEAHEPGREVSTPTAAHIEKVRRDKRLGPRVGFYVAGAGAFDRGALAATVALRVRVTERWIVGFDSEWNPWITPTYAAKAGAFNLMFTGIRRWPLAWERVNLRHTLQLGASVLLFDVYGAPGGSVGLYVATSPLGLDIDLGHALRLVIDPTNLAIPIPHLTAVPFYYLQYRITVGLQFGG